MKSTTRLAVVLCVVAMMVLSLTPDVGARHRAPTAQSEATKALQALNAELTEASRKHNELFKDAKTDDERNALFRTSPYRTFEPRFLELARRYRKDEAALEALKWLLRVANPGPVLDEALIELQSHYLQHAEMPDFCRSLVMRRSPGIEAFLRHVAEHHPVRDVQGLALLSLARHLESRLKSTKDRLESEEKWLAWARGVFRDDVVEWLLRDNPRDLTTQIDAVCATIMREFGDLPDTVYKSPNGERRSFADAVHALQFAVRPVGRRAPPFVGKDAGGNVISSEALRGKNVLLMFSANWCSPCKAMYGQLRELADIYSDKPFTIVTVMADRRVVTVADAVESGEIQWPAIWDGDDGPIAAAWHVTSYPTIYLIDGEGVIRSTDLRNDPLDDAVASLLGIDPGSRVKRDKRTRVWTLSFRDQDINGGDLPKLLEGYTEVRELDLGNNRLNDDDLTHLQSLKKLTRLNLQHTGITDEGLKRLHSMPSLRKVELYVGPDCRTTAVGRRALNALPNVQVSFITH